MSSSHNYFVVFGAAVRPDGSPSGTLKRRVDSALLSANNREFAKFLVTGGAGSHGPAEAEVMKNLLVEAGIPETDVVLESEAHDTLTSVLYCKRILEDGSDIATVTVCSSPYHIPRCRMLFALLGVKTMAGVRVSDRPALGLAKWAYYWCRDIVAFAYDCMLLLAMIAVGKAKVKG